MYVAREFQRRLVCFLVHAKGGAVCWAYERCPPAVLCKRQNGLSVLHMAITSLFGGLPRWPRKTALHVTASTAAPTSRSTQVPPRNLLAIIHRRVCRRVAASALWNATNWGQRQRHPRVQISGVKSPGAMVVQV